MKDYQVNVFYSEGDEGYIADISDLEFCSALKFKFHSLLTNTKQPAILEASNLLSPLRRDHPGAAS